ncbi:UDP-N-acetylglucosamine 4,6-dehydratase (inverting) [Lentibacter algarum]|uniref:UDP-N-acetylglucosamine 4,6-dehydratase (inverting) n=1 Tax=Lentibacter algarum TaxID=576131 RepID=UPI00339D5174
MLDVNFSNYKDLFEDKNVLITGGTGSFGKQFSKIILENFKVKKLIILSRDEMKQWEMKETFSEHAEKLRFFIGDVRDLQRLKRAFDGVDIVIHAAATKIVPTAEYNPFECIKTNINGAMNVIDASIDCNVKSVVALSTDKASSPVNLYGATKLASDKLFVAGNNYSQVNSTKFSVVRYGNVMGSRGSVIPYYLSIRNQRALPVTHPDMTRFMITLDQGVELVFTALQTMVGGEIYVKKIPSMRIKDIATLIGGPNFKCVGIRPGEKMHEQMIGIEDAIFTYEYSTYYKILPQINDYYLDENRILSGTRVSDNFSYSSDENKHWMEVEVLKSWIENNYGIIL